MQRGPPARMPRDEGGSLFCLHTCRLTTRAPASRPPARAHLTPRAPRTGSPPSTLRSMWRMTRAGSPSSSATSPLRSPSSGRSRTPFALLRPLAAPPARSASRPARLSPNGRLVLPPAHLARPAQPITARTFLARGEDAFRRADEAVRPLQSRHAPGAAPARLARRSSPPFVRRDPFLHLDPHPLSRQVREGRNFIALDDVLVLAPVVQPKQAAPGPGSAPLHGRDQRHVPARGHPARPRGARRVRETARFGVLQVITVIHNYARSPAEAELYARARAELEQARPRARAAPRTGPGSRGPVA